MSNDTDAALARLQSCMVNTRGKLISTPIVVGTDLAAALAEIERLRDYGGTARGIAEHVLSRLGYASDHRAVDDIAAMIDKGVLAGHAAGYEAGQERMREQAACYVENLIDYGMRNLGESLRTILKIEKEPANG